MVTSSFGPTMQLVCLVKMMGSGGTGEARFSGVVGIVEADRHELLRVGDAGADPGLALHQRQRLRLDLAQPRQALGADRLAGDVGHDAGEIADLAVLVEKARLFLAHRSITQKLHRVPHWLADMCQRGLYPPRKMAVIAAQVKRLPCREGLRGTRSV